MDCAQGASATLPGRHPTHERLIITREPGYTRSRGGHEGPLRRLRGRLRSGSDAIGLEHTLPDMRRARYARRSDPFVPRTIPARLTGRLRVRRIPRRALRAGLRSDIERRGRAEAAGVLARRDVLRGLRSALR